MPSASHASRASPIESHSRRPGSQRHGRRIAGTLRGRRGLFATPRFLTPRRLPPEARRNSAPDGIERTALAVGAAYSHEQDYISRAASIEWRKWSDDRNRTYLIGFGAAKDRINAPEGVNAPVLDQPRETYDYLLGLTQVLSADALVESSITWSDGRGYYSDPYKLHDQRPDHREQQTQNNRHIQAQRPPGVNAKRAEATTRSCAAGGEIK